MTKILAEENRREVIIYFDPKEYQPTRDGVLGVINGLIYAGECSGGELSRLRSGEIRVYFNPLIHATYDHRHVIAALKDEIRQPNMAATLKDGDWN